MERVDIAMNAPIDLMSVRLSILLDDRVAEADFRMTGE